MITDIDAIFKYKIADKNKLLEYGFSDNGTYFQKQVLIMKNQFTMLVIIKPNNVVGYKVFDNDFGEEYVLVHAENAQGGFISKVCNACDNVLTDIAQKCFNTEILKAEQMKRIIAAISSEYDVEPEFLWEKYPDYAVFRRKDNAKWFAAIMTVDKSKLGFEGHGNIEIIDMKAKPEYVKELLKQDGYYPGYHMNKKHWFTLCLNGSIADSTILSLLSNSFHCAANS